MCIWHFGIFLGCGHPTFDYHTPELDDPQCNVQGVNCPAWRMAPLTDSHMRCQTCEDASQKVRKAKKRELAEKLKKDAEAGNKEYKWSRSGAANIRNWMESLEEGTGDHVNEEGIETALSEVD